MKRGAVYAFVVGAAVGAWPFLGLTAARPEAQHGPGAFAIAVVLSTLSCRHPVLWFAGAAAGITLGWIMFVLVLGSDWRLLVYVVVGAGTYYLANLAVVAGLSAVVSSREGVTRSGPRAGPRNGS